MIAGELINRSKGVIIVTIDEHEVHHLGVLLEQLFRGATIQMVTITINPKGVARDHLARVDEYAFFIFFGDARPCDEPDDRLSPPSEDVSTDGKVRWYAMLRSGTDARREDSPNQFYPILVDMKTGNIVGTGEVLEEPAVPPLGQVVDGNRLIWPVNKQGGWARWMQSRNGVERLIAKGFVKAGPYNEKKQNCSIEYLGKKHEELIASGDIEITERINAPVTANFITHETRRSKTVWHRSTHDAGAWGTDLLRKLLGRSNSFTFAKSLYAVRDALQIVVGDNPDALILDFFAGSGTTLHATMVLNREDGGRRKSIIITNNEVSQQDAKKLREHGIKPGDAEWEAKGIFLSATQPRVMAAITGKDATGGAIEGAYLDGSLLSDGFNENVTFLELTYQDGDNIAIGNGFEAIAPLLWQKAGGLGSIIDKPSRDFVISEDLRYAILFKDDSWPILKNRLEEISTDIQNLFVITDSDSVFHRVVSEAHVKQIDRLYESYLRSFEIRIGGES